MKQNYPLLLFAFFCMIWSGYGQTEIFNVNGGGTFPTGWTGTNNNTSNPIDKGSYYLIDSGNPSDIITSDIYDLSSYVSAEFNLDVASFGSGNYNQAKIEISYNGGSTFTQTEVSTTTTGSSYINGGTFILSGLTNQVQIRISNNGTSGRGVRLRNLKLTASGSGSTDTELNFTSTTYTANEDDGTASICVDIMNESTTPTTADIVLTSASTPHVTYTTTGITFPANSSAQQCVTVNIADNTNCSDSTDYTFEIQNVSGGDSAVTGSNDATTLSINDDDGTSGIAYIQDFDGGTPTWNYSGSGSNNTSYGNTGYGRRISGSQSFSLNNVSTAGLEDIFLSIKNKSTGGIENADALKIYVALDGASYSSIPDITIQEEDTSDNSYNKTWNYNASGVASTVAGTPATFNGDGATGYSTINITIPNGTSSVALKIQASSGGSEYFYIDDITLSGNSCLCSAPADPVGSITGTTPACTSTDLTFTGTTPSGITNYWQTTANGTDETFNASSTYTATTSGTYYVRAYDTAGTCWSDGNLSYTVVIEEGLPTLTQPNNQTEVIPDTATFTVSSSNTDTYQWQVNTGSGWTNVTGGSGATTDTYTTTATSSAMHGNQYRCILTNICGDTTSNAATLSLSNESPNNARNSEGCFDDTSVTLSWDAPASGITPTGYIIFAIEGGTAPTGTKTDASTYTANTNFSAATTVTPASLGRVVYKGTATTTTITGLTEDNNYSFTIYAYVGETLTGWATGGTGGSTVTNGLAQADVRNLIATPLTNQVTLDWDNPLPTSCWDQLIIIANQGGVTFSPSGDGSAYSGNDNDEYTTPNQLVYETTSSVSTKSITGLINDTNYCFKIFIRRGTNWTEGVEICTTPTLTYCDSYGDTSDKGITNVTFNTINNSSNSNSDYSDFTSTSTTVNIGDTYQLSVSIQTDGSNRMYTKAWIDWNLNGDFNDSGEEYDLGYDNFANETPSYNSPLNITVPNNAETGEIRMRISSRYNSNPTSCSTNFDGETEDYSIYLQQPTNAEINIKANNISIANGFDEPYGLNNTLFAAREAYTTSTAKTYTIENLGLTTLNLTGTPIVEITGANAGDFAVSTQPSNVNIVSNGNVDFEVTFTPLGLGTRTATVSIANSDPTGNENPYTFTIEGTGECPTPTLSLLPNNGPVGTIVTITSPIPNFDLSTTATISGINAPVTFIYENELEVIIPDGAYSGIIEINDNLSCPIETPNFNVISNSGNCGGLSDLIITEIYDANSGSLGYVEFYNGTNSTINLSNYSVRRYANLTSSTITSTYTFPTNGVGSTIASGAVLVGYVGTGANSSIYDFYLGDSGFNADDRLELYNNTTLIDDWHDDNVPGENGFSYLRNINITSGNPNFDLSEWTASSTENSSNLGTFNYTMLSMPPAASSINNFSDCTLLDYSISATEGDTDTPGDLTYQWYYNNGLNNNWTAVTSSSPSGYTIIGQDGNNILIEGDTNPLSNLATYQFYCEVKEAGSCTDASNAIRPNTGIITWNGTWSSTPTISSTVMIDADYNTATDGNFSACSLVINSGKTLTITDGAYAEVYYEVNNNGTFHIENNGALIQIDDTSINTGSMSMERKASIKNYDYVYWSSPISGFNISDIAGSYYFYWHPTTINSNGTQGNWIAANNTTMDLGKGYIIRAPNGQTAPTTPGELNFTTIFSSSTPGEGVPNNGEIAVTIERGINANSDEDKNDNWNLIGNPYPSSISASDFIIENAAQLQNIDGYINIWTHGTPPSAAEASPFYQNFVSNYNSADYFYYNALGDSNGDGFSGYIAAGQSFMVNMVDGAEAATTTVTFKNSMRDKGYSNSDFFRASPDSSNEKHRFWLNLLTPTTPTNRILIGYTEAATMGEDLLFDAETVLDDTSAGVYSMIEDDYFLIQGRALPFTVTDIIPISVKTIESGSHTLALHAVDGIFETDNQTIYLKDNLLGFTHDLTAQPYTFTLEPGTYNDRFEIVFIPTTLSVDDQLSLSNTITITELQEDLVQFKVDGPHSIKHIDIIDINGRLVYSLKGNNSTEVYNLSKLSQAAYMAKITLSNGQVLSKKAIKQY
ncbi:GEVED domain-containing protein [Winogradskyella rapida]|uniref:GEVED domain-containing protein n=1 Tax=Winogradskyella rapida TaxID=549701 RepID=A0ABW3KT70_9FLAO